MAASCFDCVWINNGIFFPGSGCSPGDGLPYARFTESWGIRYTSPDPTWTLSTAGSFLAGYVSSGTNYGAGNILACGCISIGTTEFVTSNGNTGRILKMASNNNNIFTAETSTTNRYMIFESRRQSRAGSVRNAQISLGGDSSDNGEIFFMTAPGGADVSTRMMINSSGNVGIGTSSPTEVAASWTTLDVTGKSSGGGGILYLSNFGKTVTSQFYSDGSGGRLGTLCNHFLALETCNTERMRISAAGNVGIGTTSPSTVLDIRGCNTDNAVTIRNFCGDSYSAIGYYNCQGTLKAALGIGNNSAAAPFANNAYVYTPASTDFLFYIAGGERMRVRCDGNVGIGATSPSAKLHLCGSGDNIFRGESTTTGTVASYYITNVGATAKRYYAGVNVAAADGGYAISDSTCADTVRFYIKSEGSVGIGTITPSYRLHVNGTFYAAGSSIKYKEGICNYDTDSCLFMCLKPVTYQYKDEWQHLGRELKSQSQIGLIAEDVAEVMPELAVLVNEEDEKVVRNVDYEKLSVVLLKEVQKLRLEVDQLKNNK